MSSRQHRRNKDRRRQAGRKTRYDGISDEAIYERDGWQCQMPDCLHPDGRTITPGLSGSDPWQASIDHILPLMDGGEDEAANKRAAHKKCNGADTTALAISLAQLVRPAEGRGR